jgi:hypothetical protein
VRDSSRLDMDMGGVTGTEVDAEAEADVDDETLIARAGRGCELAGAELKTMTSTRARVCGAKGSEVGAWGGVGRRGAGCGWCWPR